ncbi:hypothetical protein [Aquimarina rhabdastrellae]
MLKNIKQFNGAKAITKSQQKTIKGGGSSGSTGENGNPPQCGYIINTSQGPVRKECGPNYYCVHGRCKYIYPGLD